MGAGRLAWRRSYESSLRPIAHRRAAHRRRAHRAVQLAARRHCGGTFLLRIEDTDRERSTPENVEQILDALRWLQLDWDEGPIFQGERAARHQEALEALLEGGHAYRSNATAADVAAYKQLHGAERGFRGEGSREIRKRGRSACACRPAAPPSYTT